MRVEAKWSGVRSNRLMEIRVRLSERDRKWKQKWRINANNV